MPSEHPFHCVHHHHAAHSKEVKVIPESKHSKDVVVEVGEMLRG